MSPLSAASESGRLTASVGNALTDEAAGPRGHFPRTPAGDADPAWDATPEQDIRAARGETLLVHSMAANWQTGGPAPGGDWCASRFGFDAPLSPVELKRVIFREVLACCGVPPAMLESASSTAGREADRQYRHTCVPPAGRIVQAELRAKLDAPELGLDWTELRAADIAGRAFSSQVKGGIDVAKAAVASGVLNG